MLEGTHRRSIRTKNDTTNMRDSSKQTAPESAPWFACWVRSIRHGPIHSQDLDESAELLSGYVLALFVQHTGSHYIMLMLMLTGTDRVNFPQTALQCSISF